MAIRELTEKLRKLERFSRVRHKRPPPQFAANEQSDITEITRSI